jgi:hypothetical protein
MMSAYRSIVGASLVAVLALGCGSSDDSSSDPDHGDAGIDGQVEVDGAVDAGKEGAVEASPDVQEDVPLEGLPEAEVDALPEAEVDALPEAEVDAPLDAPLDALEDVGLDSDAEDSSEPELVEVNLDLRPNCVIEFTPAALDAVAGNPIEVRVTNISSTYAASLWTSDGAAVIGFAPGQSWLSASFCSAEFPVEAHIQAFNHNDSSCSSVKLPIHCK